MKLKEKLEKSSRIFIEWNIGKLKGDDAMIELYKIFWHPYWKRVWMKHCGECGEEQNQK